jgi:hypothetical protein
VNLFTYACPAGKFTTFQAFVSAWILTSTSAFFYLNVATWGAGRVGSGALVLAGSGLSAGTPSAPFASTGNPASLGFAVSGNTVELQATGYPAPTAWAAGTFTVGRLVTKGGITYGVISISGSGTSTTGPSGSGTTTDNPGGNQVVWDAVISAPGVPAAGFVPITWCAEKVEVFTP